ncbi:hypothetical protein GDO86_012082 [Hymenochirus boettgeri]|uniref:Uncharacterized protein n=1 Tax=Hymenochirus boettgeri TaxID=247094 RepID=A0A8T2JEE4_9PIPI|nr:hypothetical protein GDO86_012082 [Hymenochirus boettgeri]
MKILVFKIGKNNLYLVYFCYTIKISQFPFRSFPTKLKSCFLYYVVSFFLIFFKKKTSKEHLGRDLVYFIHLYKILCPAPL